MQTRCALLLYIALAGIGCHPSVAAPPPTPECGLVPDPDADPRDGCHSQQCGGNSSVVNQFPVNGLRAGCWNGEGMMLEPKTLEAPRCLQKKGLTLEISNGVLIAKEQPACAGADLVGGTFQITWKHGQVLERKAVRIQAFGSVLVRDKLWPGFVFVGTDGRSLCQGAAAQTWKVTPQELSPMVVSPNEPGFADFAIIVPGAVFSERVAVLAPRDLASRDGWFNIACAADALAESEVYSLAGQSVSERRAALQMLTANYCGDAHHYTHRGVEIDWSRTDDISQDRKLEAVWTEDGAICLSHSRLFQRDASLTIGHAAGECAHHACDEREFIRRAGACRLNKRTLLPCTLADLAKSNWRSNVVNHIKD